ncbi:hypothetical protein CHISP_3696 [Chitinispirillum alkaliphilum]|nr:hypothetical protein CHISP_3696 [Chitinispirillum alkaliphilum]
MYSKLIVKILLVTLFLMVFFSYAEKPTQTGHSLGLELESFIGKRKSSIALSFNYENTFGRFIQKSEIILLDYTIPLVDFTIGYGYPIRLNKLTIIPEIHAGYFLTGLYYLEHGFCTKITTRFEKQFNNKWSISLAPTVRFDNLSTQWLLEMSPLYLTSINLGFKRNLFTNRQAAKSRKEKLVELSDHRQIKGFEIIGKATTRTLFLVEDDSDRKTEINPTQLKRGISPAIEYYWFNRNADKRYSFGIELDFYETFNSTLNDGIIYRDFSGYGLFLSYGLQSLRGTDSFFSAFGTEFIVGGNFNKYNYTEHYYLDLLAGLSPLIELSPLKKDFLRIRFSLPLTIGAQGYDLCFSTGISAALVFNPLKIGKNR